MVKQPRGASSVDADKGAAWSTRRAARRSWAAFAVGLPLLILVAALRAWDPAPLELLRLKTFDLFQQIAPRERTQRPVVIVDVDEASLRAIGQWPWSRVTLAQMIDQLTEAGALVIGLDMVFPEADRLSPDLVAAARPELGADARALLEALPTNDAVFAAALARSRVVLGQSGARALEDEAEPAAAPKTSIAALGGDPRPYLLRTPRLLRNVSELEDVAAGRGLVTIAAEPDGIVRRAPAVMEAGGVLAPTLAIEMLRVVTGQTTLVVKSTSAGVEGVLVGSVFAPTDARGRLWVHFAPHDPELYVSAVDVLEGRFEPDRFASRLVLVGTSAVGLLDVKSTPLDGFLPGVEVHAQLLETLLYQSALSRPDYAPGLELLAAILLGLLMVALVPRLAALWVLATGCALALSLVAISWYLYIQHGVLLDLIYPLFSSFAVFACLSFLNYLRDERERNQVRDAFGRYLAPDIVKSLAAHPERLTLGGETRELTILFADARGFTEVSELYRDEPQKLTALMNRLLTPLSEAILERSGTIDKYMGDAIMAFWNAPIDVADHARAGCLAALEMQRRLAALNAARRAEAEASGERFFALELGVGLNGGACVVGNMGSELRFDYSALGDAVNVASRLESLTRQLEAPILVGATTAAAARDLALIEVDRIRVKGKREPETVFALLGDDALTRRPEFVDLHARAGALLSAFRAQSWDQAEAALDALRASDAEERLAGLARVYARRIAAFRAAAPPADWDGVIDAETK